MPYAATAIMNMLDNLSGSGGMDERLCSQVVAGVG